MLRSWLKRRLPTAPAARPQAGRAAPRFRPVCESLEDRTLLSTATTSTALVATPNQSLVGETVTLTATVTPPAGAGTPSGDVTFSDNGAPLVSVAYHGGDASFTTTFAAGQHSLTATYGGDANFSASTSPPFVEQVLKAGTAVALQASPRPGTTGQQLILEARVTPAPGSTVVPTGTVTFFGNGSPLGTAPLNSLGLATLTAAALVRGSGFAAVYNGDANYLPSSSAVLPAPPVAGGAIVARVFVPPGGVQPVLDVFTPGSSTRRFRVHLRNPAFQGGARFTAAYDVNGDGVRDVVLVSNASAHGGLVEVYDGSAGQLLFRVFPYGHGFTGTVHVAVGNPAGGGARYVVTRAVVHGKRVERVYLPPLPEPLPGITAAQLGPLVFI